MTRSKIIEVMAEAWWLSAEGSYEDHLTWETWPETPRQASIAHVGMSKQELRGAMEAALTAYESHLQASGMAVVPQERMVDFFAEIEAATVSVQGALRHYQQPQDVHFHFVLKACRDGTAMLATSAHDGKTSTASADPAPAELPAPDPDAVTRR